MLEMQLVEILAPAIAICGIVLTVAGAGSILPAGLGRYAFPGPVPLPLGFVVGSRAAFLVVRRSAPRPPAPQRAVGRAGR